MASGSATELSGGSRGQGASGRSRGEMRELWFSGLSSYFQDSLPITLDILKSSFRLAHSPSSIAPLLVVVAVELICNIEKSVNYLVLKRLIYYGFQRAKA